MNKFFKCGQGHYTRNYHLIGPICFKYGKHDHISTECGQQNQHFNAKVVENHNHIIKGS